MTVSRVEFEAIVARQGARCFYCGHPITTRRKLRVHDAAALDRERRAEVRAATRDHFIPLGAGGFDAAVNIVAACGPCNALKRAGLPSLAEIVRFVDLRCYGGAALGPLAALYRFEARRVDDELRRDRR